MTTTASQNFGESAKLLKKACDLACPWGISPYSAHRDWGVSWGMRVSVPFKSLYMNLSDVSMDVLIVFINTETLPDSAKIFTSIWFEVTNCNVWIFSFSFNGLPLCFFIRRQHKWHIFFPLDGDLGHLMSSLVALQLVRLLLCSFQLEGFPFLQYNLSCLSWNALLLLCSFWNDVAKDEQLLFS